MTLVVIRLSSPEVFNNYILPKNFIRFWYQSDLSQSISHHDYDQ
jgi:hypothetical protein